jgi:hypothetical protein
MSRQIAISLVGATAIGIGLLGMSSAFAAPANGTVIGDAASDGAVAQKVFWHRGWRGVGWRGVGWRGVGWRGVGWRTGWHPGWRRGWGWRPGLAAAGVAAAGIAATATADNFGTSNYLYTTETYPRYMCCYTVVPGYEDTAAAYGFGYGNYYGGYGQPGLGAAAVGAAAAGATTRVAENETGLYRYRHNFARER